MSMLKLILNLRSTVSSSPILRRRPVAVAFLVFREMVTRDANHLAAGVAYFTLFAFFPFILSVWVLSGFFENSPDLRRGMLNFIIGNLPGSASFIQSNVGQIIQGRNELLIIAIIGLLWSSGSVYGAINRVVNRAWGIHHLHPFYVNRLRHIISLVIFGLLFFFWMTASSFLELLQDRDMGLPGQGVILESGLIQWGLLFTSWVITGLIFLIIYRFAPNCRVYWRHVWPGALIATLTFELAKGVFTWYLLNYANYDQLYGSIASAIIFLFWIYMSALILTLGAEICSNYQLIYYPMDVDENIPVQD